MNRDKELTTLVVVISLLLAGSAVAAPPVGPDRLADFETGLPANWFTFFGGSTVTTTQLTVGDADPLARPAQAGDIGILRADFSVFDFGGFGAEFASTGGPQDWSAADGFGFWFHGTGSGLAYQAEISDNRSDPNIDTSERFDKVFVDDFVGWRRIYIPWSDFTRATDFQPAGAPDDGFTLTEIWAWAIVLPLGVDTVYFDDFTLVNRIVDDFEDVAPGPLPAGADPNGIPVGYVTFAGASSAAIAAASTPPAPPSFEFGEPNNVIQVDLDVTDFAGFIHNFSNETLDAWVPQDWSDYAGFAFWMFGQNLGTTTFVDLVENRNPGSTTDDAERWTVTITDDFSGWRYFEIPFTDFVRKEIGNGAPDDGLTLEEVHGWAFGTLGTGGPVTYYLDGASLYGVGEGPPLQVVLSSGNFDIPEGATGDIAVRLTRPLGSDDPAQVSVDYVVMPGSATPDRDYVDQGTAGTLTFVSGGPSELTFPLVTLDDLKYQGTRRVVIVLSDPVDVEIGFTPTASGSILDDDPYDSRLLDDFERFPYLWDTEGAVTLANPEIAAGDPNALPGQGLWERVLEATVPLAVEIDIQPGSGSSSICNSGNGVVPVAILTTESFDATTVDHTTVTFGAAAETHVDKKTGLARRHEEDVDGDGDVDLMFHFRYRETGLGCDPADAFLEGLTFDGQPITANGVSGFHRDFALGQDWSLSDGLSFWWFGTGSGDAIRLELLDNRAPDPGPSGWELVWSDEFDGPAGAPPDPANWTHEIGDGTVNGIPGWGNQELQYYTDSTENAATDGAGNLVITAREHDGSLPCYYGPCDYTSARLISWYKAEFAYGRIETRVLVPPGEGLWPAFWSLGTDIDLVGWPQTGEIDIMEFVGRIPTEIFGTIHGPGYSGGQSFGNTYDFGFPVPDDYHTFTIEWGPDEIRWYVDGINYHNANPADVAPNEWVFNDPIFMLANLAVGGNFGGPVGEDTVFPAEYKIDYVRVYQGPDTAERWEASFVDDFSGWQQVTVPFTAFARSAEQPAGAPDDGLGLNEVWGYGFEVRGSSTGSVALDQVRLLAPSAVVVTNTNDSGPGSLRQSIAAVADGGTVTFDPALAGQTIVLGSGPLVIAKPVEIDGSAVPGLAVDGGGTDRVLIVDPTGDVSIFGLTLTGGYGWQLAGGILNNGTLSLDHVTVTGNVMETDAGDFWQGGGGIYNGGGATLDLVDSTVAGNSAQWSGGGVYSFFDTQTNVLRSTISGNVSNDVGGGIRMLGDAEIVNSTLSGNASTGWYGGAVFHTDGVMNLVNSTVADNVAPGFAPAALFVGTFTDASATMTLHNTIVDNTVAGACFVAPFGAGTVTLQSLGHNLATDATCNTTEPGDLVVLGGAGLEPLDANGGPTRTHALSPTSPAIDAADAGACPAVDQRGVARPQGAGCDIGAYELEP